MRKNKLFTFFAITILVFAFSFNNVSAAATSSGLVPCGNVDGTDNEGNPLVYPADHPTKAGQPLPAAEQCDLKALILLIRNIINFLFIISIPIATMAFVWTGVLLLTSQGNPAKIQRAKGIAIKVLFGFIFIIASWAIVYELTSRLFVDEAQFLEEPTTG